jgi:hypothetical protein
LIAKRTLLALLVAVATPALAEPARLDVDLAPRTATVGDPVIVTLTLRLDAADRDRRASFPEWGEAWGDAAVLAVSPVVQRDETGRHLVVQKLRLAAYRPGRIALPPREIHLAGAPPTSLATPADLALDIRSVLTGDDKNAAPEPADPPRALPVPAAFAWTVAALAALALAAGIVLWRRPRVASRAPAATALAPLAELERALAGLGGQPPVAAQTALSLALRRYLGRSLGFPAAESTTSELARRLDRCGLERDLVKRFVRLLRDADAVKFALQPTDGAAIARGCDEARALALAVEQHLQPPVAEGVA